MKNPYKAAFVLLSIVFIFSVIAVGFYLSQMETDPATALENYAALELRNAALQRELAAGGAASADQQKIISEYQDRISQQDLEIRTANGRITELSREKDALEARVEELQRQLAAVRDLIRN
jgi:septal ring factor EnvC (AmiA/AmiB activator)